MGGCLSKCLRKQEDDDEKWARKRRRSLEEFVGKDAEDVWSVEIDASCDTPANQRAIVSPMNSGAFATFGDYHRSSRSRTDEALRLSSCSPVSSSTTLSKSEGSKAIGEQAVKSGDDTSQSSNSETRPKRKISRIRILQLKDSTFDEEIEVVEVEDEDEDEDKVEVKMSLDSYEEPTHELENIDCSWVERARERTLAAQEAARQAAEAEKARKAPEIPVVPKGPGVTRITVRPKTPEPIIEVKPKEIVVKKQPVVVPMECEDKVVDGDIDEDEEDDGMETDTSCTASTDSGGMGDHSVEKPARVKKMRPRKIYPYTRGVMIPVDQFDPLQPWNDPEPSELAKLRQEYMARKKQKEYEEFAKRHLKPSEKAQATEGKILRGTLITWPKYIKDRDVLGLSKTGTDVVNVGGRVKAKMAWGGETSTYSSPTPVHDPNMQFKRNGQADAADTKHRLPASAVKIVAKDNGQTVPRSLNANQVQHFAYQPPEFYVRPKPKPHFKEKQLTFHPSVQPEENDEEDIDFDFTPENLRRYAKRRQERLRRRPKTPFHRVSESISKDSDDDGIPSPAQPAQRPEGVKKPSPAADPARSTSGDKKCVSFVIPVRDSPASRPNTRRHGDVRPMTARANAEELARRQAEADKRRSEAIKSRAQKLRHKTARELEMIRLDADRAKVAKLREQVEAKMRRLEENRKKRIEGIVAKQTEHIQHVKDKHDVVFTRKRFTGLERDVSPDPNDVQFTLQDILDIDRFFEEIDNQ